MKRKKTFIYKEISIEQIEQLFDSDYSCYKKEFICDGDRQVVSTNIIYDVANVVIRKKDKK